MTTTYPGQCQICGRRNNQPDGHSEFCGCTKCSRTCFGGCRQQGFTLAELRVGMEELALPDNVADQVIRYFREKLND